MDDANAVYWNDRRAISLANRIKDKVVTELKVVTKQSYQFDSVQGQQTYQVPERYVASELLYYNSSYNREIVLKDSPRDIYLPYPNVTTQGWPSIGFIWGVSGRRELTIYPTFNADGIEITWWFWGYAPDIDEDNDEFALPTDWHPAIVEGMINERAARDGEINMADNLLLWKDEIRKIKAMQTYQHLLGRTKQYGSFDGQFSRISASADKEELPFRIVGTDGGIW
jgi:hypothetical protein